MKFPRIPGPRGTLRTLKIEIIFESRRERVWGSREKEKREGSRTKRLRSERRTRTIVSRRSRPLLEIAGHRVNRFGGRYCRATTRKSERKHDSFFFYSLHSSFIYSSPFFPLIFVVCASLHTRRFYHGET